MNKIEKSPNQAIKRAVEALREQGIIVYPTDTLYGLGTDATNERCVQKIFSIKERDRDRPISAMVSDPNMLKKYSHMNPPQEEIVKRILPGKATVILEGKGLSDNISKSGVGFRIPDHDTSRKIVEEFNRPITSTSTNPSGKKPANTIKEAEAYFQDKIDLYIDSGTLEEKPSTVVDLRNFKIIREGSELQKIQKIIKKYR